MSRAGLKLIVNCLSYLESIIADHEWFAFVPAWIIKGREGYLRRITPDYCHTLSSPFGRWDAAGRTVCTVKKKKEKDNAVKSILPEPYGACHA